MVPLRKPLALAVLALAAPARADDAPPALRPARELGAHLDVDLDLGSPTADNESRLSLGVGGRFGWRFDLGPVWLQPEAGASYTAFSPYVYPYPPGVCLSCYPLIAEHPVRVFGGLRLGGAGLIAGAIEPALFGHAGYGWDTAGFLHPNAPGGTTPTTIVDREGPAFDVGFAFDVRVIRYFRFGLHGAYNVVASLPVSGFTAGNYGSVRWFSYGLHLGAAI
jgi:hypothetical protein